MVIIEWRFFRTFTGTVAFVTKVAQVNCGRFILVIAVAGALAGAYLAGKSDQPTNPESISALNHPEDNSCGFVPSVIDLGVQPWAKNVPISLTFENWSDRAVTIQKAHASCGCLIIEGTELLKGRTLAPGESLVMDAILDTRKKIGPLVRTATITLGDGQFRTVAINLDVEGAWSISSNKLDFGDIAIDKLTEDAPSQSVLFTASPAQMSSVPEADVPWVTCETAARSDNRTEILATIRREILPPGVNQGVILFDTTCADVNSGAIFVQARGIQTLTAEPAHVFLRGDTPKTVRVSLEDGQPATLISARSDNENILATIKKDGTLEIRNLVGKPTPELAMVTIVDDQDHLLRIPVSTF